MKKRYYSTVRFLLIIMALFSCDKEEKIVLPKVDTASVDEIYNTSARVGGRISDNGGAEITERGVYWSTSAAPETSGTMVQIGTGSGTFYQTLSGLTSGVKYYVKAYAINSKGKSFGNETFFTTQINLPIIITSGVTEFTTTSARVGGNITDNGGFEVTQRGIFWGTEPDPRLTGTKMVIGSGNGNFSQTLTGLSQAFTYYVVAFATNIKGTVYGKEIIFSTQPGLPVVVTATVTDIKAYSLKAGGNISSSGGSDITERGIYWGLSPQPQTTGTKLKIGSGTGNFIDSLMKLNPGTKYYVKAYATNSMGTSFGEEKNCTTLGAKPAARNLKYTDLTSTGIRLYGIISANDLSTSVTFEYGTTTSYGGISVPPDNPVTKNTDTVITIITGLLPRTLYHFRIKAENDLGIVYSRDSTFTTVITGITGTVSDSDGNTYQTIGIGYQEWMTENLKTAKFNTGDSITLAKNDTLWKALTSPGFCWYNNIEANKNAYGALYNWYAVSSNKKLCPSGWHVPTNDDISKLVDYLGDAGNAGGILKESGTVNWNTPNTGATNDYGFTARAGGKRSADGSFDFMKVEGNWWSSSEYSTLNASYIYILFNYANSFQAYYNKKSGMSVRCVKD
jgi:uncharacterized protein (TIGR02145 family)